MLGTIEGVGSRYDIGGARAPARSIDDFPPVLESAETMASAAPTLAAVGEMLRLVVLAHRADELVAVELGSGAFVRARYAHHGPDAELLDTYSIVDVEVAPRDEIPDPARPEEVTISRTPSTIARLRRRRAKRLLETVLLPPGQPLLGFTGPAIPYWTVSGENPSLALIAPEKGPQLLVRRGEDTVRARFMWGGTEHQLPVDDPALERMVHSSPRPRLGGAALAAAAGHDASYLLVGLTPPRNGHCYKTVIGLLPKP